ncbi:MAG: holo-ACP synthase [Kineosporiaceae bacterium]
MAAAPAPAGVPGTDIVSVARIAALLDRGGPDFTRRWFTDAEIAYCTSRARPGQHFAARAAGKEAVIKALRLAWDGPVAWSSVEIVRDDRGAPRVRLHGRVAEAAALAGIGEVALSLSHCDDYAVAMALAYPAGG